jgi:rare lipoprotein A
MIMRVILLALTITSLAACRGNLPRPGPGDEDYDPDDRRARPAAVEKSSERESDRREDTATKEQTKTGSGAYLSGDGPGDDTPSNLSQTPDAVPSNEPLHRYANRPYMVMGKNYTPLTTVGSYKERGIASWYGKKFHGQKTSIGETYDMYGMTAASTTLPIPSYARVTNLQNKKSVIVRVNDRGPFLHERVIDLSYTAASKLGIIGAGQGEVEVESLTPDDNATAIIVPLHKEPIQVTPLPSITAPVAEGNIYLQLGAFSSQGGAEKFLISMKSKLGDTGKQLSLSNKNGMVKVRIGPYTSKESARTSALTLEGRLGFKPVVSLY